MSLPHVELDFPNEYASMEMIVDGIVVGTARVSLEAPCTIGGRAVRPATLAGATNSFISLFRPRSGEATSWLAVDTGLPLVHVTDDTTPKRHHHVVVDFRGEGYHVDYTRRSAKRTHQRKKRLRLPEGERAHDLGSLAAALRSWSPAKGDEAHSYLVFKRRLWRVAVRFAGEDRVREGRRAVRTWRYDGVAHRLSIKTLLPNPAKERRFTLWFAQDRFRVPIRALIHTPRHTIELARTGYRSKPSASPFDSHLPACGNDSINTH